MKRTINLIIFSVISFLIVLIAGCDNSNDPTFDEALLLEKAKNNNLESQIELGYRYFTGDGLKKDEKEGFHWFKEAAASGDTDAIYFLGQMYKNGAGVPKNPKEAEKLYLNLAKTGNHRFMLILGELYLFDLKEVTKGLRWIKKASDEGNLDAIFSMGALLFWGGNFIEQNHEASKEYFDTFFDVLEKTKDEEGSYNAINLYQIGTIYQYGYGGYKKNISTATFFFKEAIKKEEIYSSFELAYMLYNGDGVARDVKESKRLIEKILPAMNFFVAYGDPYTSYQLYLLQTLGLGVEKDIEKSFKLLQHAADNNISAALLELGHYYYLPGVHVKQDVEKGIEYIKKSTEFNNDIALYSLGLLYEKGIGVAHDLPQAIDYYKKSSNLKNVDALYKLGTLSLNGHGMEQDKKRAFDYFSEAASYGHGDSMFMLGEFYSSGYIEYNFAKAKDWYGKAINAHPPSSGPKIDSAPAHFYSLVAQTLEYQNIEYYEKEIEGLQLQIDFLKKDMEYYKP